MFEIMIDTRIFSYPKRFITGSKIKELGDIPVNYGVWLKNNGLEEDRQIRDSDEIDLSASKTKAISFFHFYSGAKHITAGSAVKVVVYQATARLHPI